MKELIRTTDPVLISWTRDHLARNGIETVVFDTHASIVEGSIGALPRRIMVGDDDLDRARRLLAAARAEREGAHGDA